MKIESVTVGPFEENTYLVHDGRGNGVFVDPGDEPARLIRLAETHGVTPQAIWLTHAHLDHIGGIAGVKRKWDVPVYMHPADAPVFAYGERSAATYNVPFEQPAPPEKELAEGDTLKVGDTVFTVWHVPGHAPGHVIFIGGGVMLGGDLIFDGSIGRVDLPMSSPRDMQASLDRLSSLGDETVIYPGHGPLTTLARERDSNPFLAGVARVLVR